MVDAVTIFTHCRSLLIPGLVRNSLRTGPAPGLRAFAVRFVIAACAIALSYARAWAGPATHFEITPTFVLAGTQATFTITAQDSSNNIDPAPRTVIVEYPQDLPGTFQPTSVGLTFGTGAFQGILKVGNHLIILVDKDNPNFTTFVLLTGS